MNNDSLTHQDRKFKQISILLSEIIDSWVGPLLEYIYDLGGTQNEAARRLNKDPGFISKKYGKGGVNRDK